MLRGKQRILLTLATGTDKTVIAFQMYWRLWSAGWNRSGAYRKPRILYLADHNILIDEPKDTIFAPFGDACAANSPRRLSQRHGRPRAQLRGLGLPPIELIQLGDAYFVRDGHHRISVASALGQHHIDAVVTILHVTAPLQKQRPLVEHARPQRSRPLLPSLAWRSTGDA